MPLRRLIYRLLIYALLFALLLATGWTALELGRVYTQKQAVIGTLDARRPLYAATATALAPANAGLENQAQTLLMQQVFATNTPQLTPMPSPLPTVEMQIQPTPVTLPRLLIPRDPAPGLELSGTAVPTRVPVIPREYELVNIILLGGDDEVVNDGTIRTDTMIVVSLNTETSTISMLSLPRDLFVYIPSGIMGRLNRAYGIGENAGWQPDGGFGLLRQTIFYNFGINVHYYARVSFSSFEAIIDSLGGVDIAVDCAYRDYYPAVRLDPQADANEFVLRTLDVGYYTFDGYDALWYARTRRYTDDFDRGRRQQQLLRGMWRKANANGLLANLPTLWDEITSTVDTNLPFEVMLGLLPHLIDFDISSLENLTLRRTYHTEPWRTPQGDHVQLPQYEPIAALLHDFYTPPTQNQLALAGPSIAVYNASGNPNWDIVASERLRWEGLNAIALGEPERGGTLDSSQLLDAVALSKGSLVPSLLKTLNMSLAQLQVQANPLRDYDYEVRLGGDYDSCTFGVLPIDPPAAG